MPGRGVLSAADVVKFANLVEELALSDGCDIWRHVTTDDPGGGHIDTWMPIAVNVSCRVQPKRVAQQEGIGLNRVVAEGEYSISLKRGTDVTPADRIDWKGHTFEVTSVAHQTIEIFRSVDAKLIA